MLKKFNMLYQKIFVENHKLEPTSEMVNDLADDENFIQCKQGYCFFAIPHGEKPIIYNLFIFPEFRRKRHAQRLLELVVYYIRKTGYNGDICIEAKPKENNISKEDLSKFYNKLGLTIISNNESEQNN